MDKLKADGGLEETVEGAKSDSVNRASLRNFNCNMKCHPNMNCSCWDHTTIAIPPATELVPFHYLLIMSESKTGLSALRLRAP